MLFIANVNEFLYICHPIVISIYPNHIVNILFITMINTKMAFIVII